uniref:ATP/GTP binding protein like 4 n=1 Tax=Anser cygnoides TaxID=8845 RepID=A0A8B9ES83_ANSCY
MLMQMMRGGHQLMVLYSFLLPPTFPLQTELTPPAATFVRDILIFLCLWGSKTPENGEIANLRPGAEQKVVFITARVHPGETPSSFVCQGIIDFLVSQHPIAKVLRDHLVFKIAPMLNPDGVYLGNYRCSLMGFDLNRHWANPSPWAHPTLHGVKQLIIEMYNNPKINLEFYIDIHAHSTMMNGFMYGNIFEDEERFQRQAVLPKLLCQNAEDFSYSSTSFNRDAVKAGTGRRFLGGLLNDTSYCYTLEVSFYSYIVGGTTTAVPYTEEACILLKSCLLLQRT